MSALTFVFHLLGLRTRKLPGTGNPLSSHYNLRILVGTCSGKHSPALTNSMAGGRPGIDFDEETEHVWKSGAASWETSASFRPSSDTQTSVPRNKTH